jgi:hypothetical protein
MHHMYEILELKYMGVIIVSFWAMWTITSLLENYRFKVHWIRDYYEIYNF